ncbi:hypothetical protein GLOIN_2v1874770 [Rhizophagus irregularis DAOM 181602=DAOM 197198]|nr:hypothetical protein GLOIN_2v1874770 [Rhizophagus irregularis DAOM 181602=DAOM 197198]
MIVEDVTEKANADAFFIISDKDRSIINDSSIFLRRTPPPDNDSHTALSDNSYVSAAVGQYRTFIPHLTVFTCGIVRRKKNTVDRLVKISLFCFFSLFSLNARVQCW